MLDIPTENEEQAALMEWSRYEERTHPELRLLFAIPNGGYRAPKTALMLKKTGVKPGVPDLFLPVPRSPYHGLFVEMKRTKGGSVSIYQKVWMNELSGKGYRVVIAKGWQDAAMKIKGYLEE